MRKAIYTFLCSCGILILGSCSEKNNIKYKSEESIYSNSEEKIDAIRIFYTPFYLIFEFFSPVDSIMSGKEYLLMSDCNLHFDKNMKMKAEKIFNTSIVNQVKLNDELKKELDVRVCCQFLKNDSTIFSFGLTTSTEKMIVNDKLVKGEESFYRFVSHFLPYYESIEYQRNLNQMFK